MSDNFKFVLDEKGVKENILQADYMLEYVKQEAANRAGSDTHINAFIGLKACRAIAYVNPNTKEHPG